MNNSSNDTLLLQEKLLSENYDIALKASDSLAEIGTEEVVLFLIKNLSSKIDDHRNLSALALREIQSNLAVKPLINSILNPENRNNCGTMVYALGNLDCSSYLVDFFKIYMYGNMECKTEINSILDNQSFIYDERDLTIITSLWEDCKIHPNKCPKFHETKNYIQDDIDWFSQNM